MKLHKIELFICDPNHDWSLADQKIAIENGLGDSVFWFGECKSKGVGAWEDDHILNNNKINIKKYWEEINP